MSITRPLGLPVPMSNRDELIEYRLEKLEDAILKLAENHQILTRLEVQAVDTLRSVHQQFEEIQKLRNDFNIAQRTFSDHRVEFSKIQQEVDGFKWVKRTILGSILTGLVGAIMLLI